MHLDCGDVIINIGGDSVIDSAKPFDRTIELIKQHRERPLTIKFLAQSTPAPYIVHFPDETLGVSLTSKEASDEFPVVWKRDAEQLLNDDSDATDVFPESTLLMRLPARLLTTPNKLSLLSF